MCQPHAHGGSKSNAQLGYSDQTTNLAGAVPAAHTCDHVRTPTCSAATAIPGGLDRLAAAQLIRPVPVAFFRIHSAIAAFSQPGLSMFD